MTETNINRTFLILILGILAVIGPFSIDMYIPGFQNIARDFGVNEKEVAYTMTSFFVGISLGQLFYGPVIDKYGRRKPLLAGLLLYAIASLGCAFSSNIESMTFLRFFQSLGSCAGIVASNAIVVDVFEEERRPRIFSYIMLVMGVGPLIAPSIGSLFLEIGSWHDMFYFMAAFSLLVFAMIFFFLPETNRFQNIQKLEVSQVFQSYIGVIRDKRFFTYTMGGSIANSILFGYLSAASFIFISHYGLSHRVFSIVFAINASGLIAGSYINGYLTKYYNYLKIIQLASLLLLILSLLVVFLVALYPQMHYTRMVLSVFSILFLIGFIYPNAIAASLSPFQQNAGTAAALGGSMRMAFGALISGLIGWLQSENILIIFLITLALSALAAIFIFWASRINLSAGGK
ncbi:MAG: multidrug effflux MFS transporter [Chitinophagales bacterium]|nr:multidrug effflux MFS transporter [Chitinophagales bacterium]MCZ2393125.1 multidrug effflux MFS transporter [Chitinophagales bacterium]